MSEIDTYIKENAEVHQFAAEVARIISGIPQMPEFSSESMSVSDTSKLIGLPATSIRAGIVYGWLPIGTAIQNNKPAKSLSGGRITYIISPRKVYEVTGHVWKGKAALLTPSRGSRHLHPGALHPLKHFSGYRLIKIRRN